MSSLWLFPPLLRRSCSCSLLILSSRIQRTVLCFIDSTSAFRLRHHPHRQGAPPLAQGGGAPGLPQRHRRFHTCRSCESPVGSAFVWFLLPSIVVFCSPQPTADFVVATSVSRADAAPHLVVATPVSLADAAILLLRSPGAAPPRLPATTTFVRRCAFIYSINSAWFNRLGAAPHSRPAEHYPCLRFCAPWPIFFASRRPSQSPHPRLGRPAPFLS